MKRDFEKEYRELKLNETPDLWNRIEVGLSDRKSVISAMEKSPVKIGKYKSDKKMLWRTWGVAVAACLCVAIVFPAISFVIGKQGNRKGAYSGTDGAAPTESLNNDTDSAASPESLNNEIDNAVSSADSVMQNEAVSSPDSDMYSEAARENDRDMSAGAGKKEVGSMYNETEEAADKEMFDTADGVTAGVYAEDNIIDNEKNMTQSSVFAEDTENYDEKYAATEEAAQSTIPDINNGQNIKGVTVKITGIYAAGRGRETVYNAVVEKSDEEGILSEGLKIYVVCDKDTDITLAEDKSYELYLKYEKYENSEKAESRNDALTGGRFAVVSVEK